MNPQLAFLLNQCVMCLQGNNDHSAELFLKQAIKLAPKNPDVLRFYGIIEAKRNNLDSALAYFQRALKEAPKNAFVNSNIGNIFLELKRYEEALSSYEKAILFDPGYAESYNNKGNALQGLKRYDEALLAYDKALLIDPNYAQAWSNKGNTLHELKRYDEAIAHFDQALVLNPEYCEAYCNKGVTLYELLRYDEALLAYDKALLINPNYAQGYNNKGNALQRLNCLEQALIAYDQALSVDHFYAEAHCNIGKVLLDLGRYDDALIALDKAIAIDSSCIQAYYNKSILLQSLRLYDEALGVLHKVIEICPEYADAHLTASFLNLRLGNFFKGWHEFEWRWFAPDCNSIQLQTTKPSWDGEETQRRLLVWPEQGVGDKILFSSMLQELSRLMSNVIVSTDARLVPIFKRSFPDIEFVDERISISQESYDVQIPMGGLMKHLRPSAQSFKGVSFPYLVDDERKTESLINSLDWPKTNKLICGLSWRSANKKMGNHKSIPFAKFSTLLDLEGFEFINLQYGDITPDLKELEPSSSQKIHQIPGIDLYDDLDGTLSLIQACDLIVTCSNSVAHMAGALNKKTILMLPFESGKFWYWHEVAGESLCYPSVAIFSQSQQGRWDDVVEQVKVFMEDLG